MNQKGHQIYFGKNKQRYVNSWAEETNTFKDVLKLDLQIWDDQSIVDMIESHYEERVLLAFHKINPYAYKADFARLLVLHTFGGWYSDFGIKFLSYADPGKSSLIIFYDHVAKTMYGYGAIQNSIIYSQKENPTLKYLIDSLTHIILSKDYGQNPLDVTGPLRLFSLLKNRGLFLGKGEFLYDCGNALVDPSNNKTFIRGSADYDKAVSDIFSGEPTTSRLVYEMSGNPFALYKDFNKNTTLKSYHDVDADYWQCWDAKIVYS